MNAVTKSQAILLSAHGGRLALSLVIAALLGRNLEAADFGFVALVSSVYVVAVEALDLGTTAAATRQVSGHGAPERETLAALLSLRRLLAIAVMAAVLILACSGYIDRNDQRWVLGAAAGGVLLLHLHAWQVPFQLRQAYGPVTALALGSQVGFLAACAAALTLQADGIVIALLVVLREAAQALGIRAVGRRALGAPLRVAVVAADAGSLLRAAWMIGIAGLAYKSCAWAGGFILWELASPEALASFNAAQRLLAPMADMAWLVALPLIAAFSASAARDVAAFRVQLSGHLKLMLALSSLVAVAGYFVAPFVLRLLYGELYASGPWSSVAAFRWMALACLFALVSPVLVVGEIARGHARALLLAAAAAFACNLAVNAWAIPAHGAEGAAIAFACSEALFLSILTARCILRGDMRPTPAWSAYLAPAALMGGGLWVLREAPAWQLILAMAWAPASLLAIIQLPAQRACRRALSPVGLPPDEPQSAAASAH